MTLPCGLGPEDIRQLIKISNEKGRVSYKMFPQIAEYFIEQLAAINNRKPDDLLLELINGENLPQSLEFDQGKYQDEQAGIKEVRQAISDLMGIGV